MVKVKVPWSGSQVAKKSTATPNTSKASKSSTTPKMSKKAAISEKDRKYRDKLKLDPIRYNEYLRKARECYKKKKEAGIFKGIADRSEREQRRQRKEWKRNQSHYRERRKASLLTPPVSPIRSKSHSPTPSGSHSPISSRSPSPTPGGSRKRIRSSSPSPTPGGSRKRIQSTSPSPTPGGSRDEDSAQKKRGRKQVRRDRSVANRNNIKLEEDIRLLNEKLVEKKRAIKTLQKRLERANKDKKSKKKHKQIIYKYKRKLVASRVAAFMLRDDNSRTLPGKKQYLTKHRVKKQIHVLSRSLKLTYGKYISENPKSKTAYSTFCRYRPFFVKLPSLGLRDTCECKKHANLTFMAETLFYAKAVNTKNLDVLADSICCDGNQKNCAYRKCAQCARKTLNVTPEYDTIKNNTVTWDRWQNVQRSYSNKLGEPCNTKNMVTLTETGPIHELVKLFESNLRESCRHLYNVTHQYNAVHKLKETLQPNEAVLHCDFSENFVGKKFKEVTQTHYGSTHRQVSLHQGIVNTSEGNWGFCTMSDNLNHGPFGIWTHLDPVLQTICANESIDTLHFVSDGPTSQYRSKLNFYLASTLPFQKYGLKKVTWSFMEAGHGKSPADGIGGAIKRTGDELVSGGRNITCAADMYNELVTNDTTGKVTKYLITDEQFNSLDESVDKKSLKTYDGTMRVHQICTNDDMVGSVYLRDVSCFCVRDKSICLCYDNKFFTITSKTHVVVPVVDTSESQMASTNEGNCVIEVQSANENVDLTDVNITVEVQMTSENVNMLCANSAVESHDDSRNVDMVDINSTVENQGRSDNIEMNVIDNSLEVEARNADVNLLVENMIVSIESMDETNDIVTVSYDEYLTSLMVTDVAMVPAGNDVANDVAMSNVPAGSHVAHDLATSNVQVDNDVAAASVNDVVHLPVPKKARARLKSAIVPSKKVSAASTKKANKKRKANKYVSNDSPCSSCGWGYGDPSDPRSTDEWVMCVGCHKWLHLSCAENIGVIDDDNTYTCVSCL